MSLYVDSNNNKILSLQTGSIQIMFLRRLYIFMY